MPSSTYVIVEPSNGDFDIQPAPNPYEIGELVPSARPELEGVALFLYRQSSKRQRTSIARRQCSSSGRLWWRWVVVSFR